MSNKVYKKLIKLGNSYCLVIPKEIKTTLNIDTNTMLLVYSTNGRVIIEPIYEYQQPVEEFEPDGPELIAARTRSNTKRIT